MATGEKPRWSQAFRKSRLCKCVFNVSSDYEDAVRDVLREVPGTASGGMFNSSDEAWPLLDGVVITHSHYGFPAGHFADGMKVVGFKPMRLLCSLLDLEAPRRLDGEEHVPAAEALQAEWQRQLEHPDDPLYKRNMDRAVGTRDRYRLRDLVTTLFESR